MRALRIALVTLTAAALPACTTDGYELFVDVRTDLVVGVEFDRVFVSLDDARTADRDFAITDVPEDRFRVAEFGAVSRGAHRVLVQIELEDARVMTRRLAVQMTGDLVALVLMTRDCREVGCPGPADGPTETECLGGQCVEPDCLDTRTCVAPECTSDAECTTPVPCAVPLCFDGLCLFGSGASCAAGEYCDPDEGCVPLPDAPPPFDGGRVDAGTPTDAATDADPRAACTGADAGGWPGPTPCRVGSWTGRCEPDDAGVLTCVRVPCELGGLCGVDPDPDPSGTRIGYCIADGTSFNQCCFGCARAGVCIQEASPTACGQGAGPCSDCASVSCTTGRCTGGQCEMRPGFCLVDGVCYAAGVDPTNECQECTPDFYPYLLYLANGSCMGGAGRCYHGEDATGEWEGRCCTTGCIAGAPADQTCAPGNTSALCGRGGADCVDCGGRPCVGGTCT